MSDLDQLPARELHQLIPERTVTISPELLEVWHRYRWPGKTRQLANACALLGSHETMIGWDPLPDDLVLALQACDAKGGRRRPATR